MAARAQHLRALSEPQVKSSEDLTPMVSSYPGSPGSSPALTSAWEKLDRYKLVSPLARGGMAEVFLAAQEVGAFEHRPVVLKRLYAHLAADTNLVQMFLDEARLLCQLEHPHVVRTFEAGIVDGHCCIAMEYLEGQSLAFLLKRAHEQGTMTPELAIEIVDSILSGLHYTHEARDENGRSLAIVHRDVSPHNVFVTSDGQVKLLDFGVAKARSQESRTRTGIVKGKPGYMAPEQAKGETIDRRADVWSAGVILWEALTGARLFKADTEAAAALLTLTARVPPPSTVRPGIPAAIDAIVALALERNVERRYQTAFDMRMDLQAASPWSSKDPGGLARLMQKTFASEITEQRRLVAALMARSDCTPPSGRPPAAAPAKPVTPPPAPARSTPPPPPAPATPGAKRPPSPRAVSAPGPKPERRRGAAFAIAFALSFALVLGGWKLFSGVKGDVKSGASDLTVRAPAPPEGAPASAQEPADVAHAVEPVPATPPSIAVPAAPAVASAPPAVTAPLPAVPLLVPRKPQRPAATLPSATEPAPAPPAPLAPANPSREEPPDPEPAPASGALTLDTTPWSVVSTGGRILGQTPLIGVRLPAGTHTLTMKNPELGLETTYTVKIEAGKTQTRRIGLE